MAEKEKAVFKKKEKKEHPRGREGRERMGLFTWYFKADSDLLVESNKSCSIRILCRILKPYVILRS